MHPDLTPLEHVDELHRLIDESQSRPVLLFKHSYTCGVSMEALDELVAHMTDRGPDASAPQQQEVAPRYAMVTVQTHRAVSNAIAQKLGVRHETPQALLIKDGKVVWSASHFRVTAAAVDERSGCDPDSHRILIAIHQLPDVARQPRDLLTAALADVGQ